MTQCWDSREVGDRRSQRRSHGKVFWTVCVSEYVRHHSGLKTLSLHFHDDTTKSIGICTICKKVYGVVVATGVG
eukprot:scaffold8448_cov120-Skeletonema_dohrnii-CCMP3373.AAC.2